MKHYVIKTTDGNRYELFGSNPTEMVLWGIECLAFRTVDGKFRYISKANIVTITIWEDEE